MSFCKSARGPVHRLARAAGLSALLALAACQSGPLYGGGGVDPASGRAQAGLETLAGRVAVVEPQSRTEQVVRNPLLFQLNGAEAVREPLYEVALVTTASSTPVSIQGGSGVPTANLFQLNATYTLTRLADGQVLDRGTRRVTAPYDRSEQLFAAQRALIDARLQAGDTLARQIALALSPVLRREALSGGVAAALPAR